MADVQRAGASDTKLKIFISYSRKDTTFAEELIMGLEVAGFAPYFDRHDIAPGEAWEDRLGQLIVEADTVVFVISPNSIASERCAWEIAETERLSKRLLPVVWRAVEERLVPERLKRLNYIFFDEGHSFAKSLGDLARAINTDTGWIREHTRLGEAASRWQGIRAGQDHALLVGKDIDDAEAWLENQPKGAPGPTDLQRAFIVASRQAEDVRQHKERNQIEAIARAQAARARFQRQFSYALMAIAILVAGAAAWSSFLAWEAQVREIKVLTSLAQRAIEEAQFDRAIRIAVHGLPPPGQLPLSPSWEHQSVKGLEANLAGAAYNSRLIAQLRGHTLPVREIVFSPDGTTVLTAPGAFFKYVPAERIVTEGLHLKDKTARVWDIKSGRLLHILGGHADFVLSATFSPNGTRIATFSGDEARIWNAATGAQIALAKLPEAQSDVRVRLVSDETLLLLSAEGARSWDIERNRELRFFGGRAGSVSPDGTRIATIANEGATVSRVSDGSLILAAPSAQRFRYVDFSADSRRILALDDVGTCSIWDAVTGEKLKAFSVRVSTVSASLSADGRRLLTRAEDDQLDVWDVQTGRMLTSFRHDGSITAAALSPQGDHVATSSFDGARLWDASTGHLIARLRGQSSLVLNVAFSHDGTSLASASMDESVRLWRTRDEIVWSRTFKDGHFSPDGRKVLVPSGAQGVRIVDSANGEPLVLLEGSKDSDIYQSVFSPDGAFIATSGESKSARIWEAKTGKLIASADAFFHELSPNGQRFAARLPSGDLGIFNSIDGTEMLRIPIGTKDVRGLSFSGDGRRIAVGTQEDETVQVWDASTGKIVASSKIKSLYRTMMNHGGDRVLARAGNTILIDATTGAEIASLPGAVAVFNATGTLVATSHHDNAARIWSARTGKLLNELRTTDLLVSTVVFSPDSERLVTQSVNGPVRVWDAASGKEIASVSLTTPFNVRFSADGSQVLFEEDGRLGTVDMQWLRHRRSSLVSHACGQLLSGARSFTANDAADPVLAGEAGTSPCDRVGPLSAEYWSSLFKRF